MKITVALCTWNRADLLAQTLDTISALKLPAGVSWEALVVDNNSTDRTPEVLDSYSERLPLRSVFEKRQGNSHARNAVVDNSSGEYIIWTDDDCLVHADWMTAYLDAFDAYPGAGLFGGPVGPTLEGTPPDWMETGLRLLPGVFSLVDHGDEEMGLSGEDLLWGANFAVKTEVHRNFRYDPNLGRVGNCLRSGEEAAVMTAILEAGHEGRWVPKAKVLHFIPKVRQQESFIRRRLFAHGRQTVGEGDGKGAYLFGRPRWVWKAAVLEEIRYRFHRLTASPEVWIKDLGRAAQTQGMLVGAYRQEDDPSGGSG